MFSDWLAATLQGAGLSAGLIIAIGPQNAFVLRQGLRRQHVGIVVGLSAFFDVALIAAGAFGLAHLFAAAPVLMAVAIWGGIVFLGWYALCALRRAFGPDAELQADATGAETARSAALSATALALLNPHVYLDTVVLLGTVAGTYADSGTRMAFAAGAGAMSVLWFVAVGYGARLVAPVFARPMAWRVVDLIVATAMGWIALSLLREALG